jgi:hypothetical protein
MPPILAAPRRSRAWVSEHIGPLFPVQRREDHRPNLAGGQLSARAVLGANSWFSAPLAGGPHRHQAEPQPHSRIAGQGSRRATYFGRRILDRHRALSTRIRRRSRPADSNLTGRGALAIRPSRFALLRIRADSLEPAAFSSGANGLARLRKNTTRTLQLILLLN